MTWKGIVPGGANGWTLAQTRGWLNNIQFTSWRPSGIVLHNTAAPTLQQWLDGERVRPGQRIPSLEHYYSVDQGWTAGPHFFVALAIYPFTPVNVSGVHSPSYNGTKLGIEMVGNYEKGGDDDDVGNGYKVKQLTAGLFAALYSRLGIDPDAPGAFHMHRDDPKTTHHCPGDDLYNDRVGFLEMVKQFMGDGGDHPDQPSMDYKPTTAPEPQPQEMYVAPRVGSGGLNLRSGAGLGSVIIAVLPPKQKVAVYKTTMNSSTSWSYVWARLLNGKEAAGWVASRYLTT